MVNLTLKCFKPENSHSLEIQEYILNSYHAICWTSIITTAIDSKCWERIQIEFITYLGLANYASRATKVNAAMDLDTENCLHSEQYISSGSYLKFCWWILRQRAYSTCWEAPTTRPIFSAIILSKCLQRSLDSCCNVRISVFILCASLSAAPGKIV